LIPSSRSTAPPSTTRRFARPRPTAPAGPTAICGGSGAPPPGGPRPSTWARRSTPTPTSSSRRSPPTGRSTGTAIAPDGVGAWDLWRAPRTGAGFGAAAPLPGDLNTAIWEFNPTLTPGGRLLALGSLDPDPAAPYSDVFFSLRVAGEYSAAVDAGPCVNTELEEYHPTIDWARNRLIFVRRNPDTSGDFYAVPLTAALRALAE
jgi:hypothetical protein